MEAKRSDISTSDRELVFNRIFNAPRALVFEAWTSMEHLPHWYGPDGFTITTHEADVRPGGKWHLTMHGPDGTDYPNLIRYHEVIIPEKLVYSHGSGEPNDPGDFEVVILFNELNGKTELVMKITFASADALKMVVERSGAIAGNRQTMNKLETYLATINKIS